MKVMIIDDDLLMLENLQSLVDWDKINMRLVSTCINGRDALNELEICKPDIVIADISMPIIDGLEFSKQALKIFPDLKIMLLTSYSKFEYAKMAIEIGISAYILKHELDSDTLKEYLLKEKHEILKNRKLRYIEDSDRSMKKALVDSNIYDDSLNSIDGKDYENILGSYLDQTKEYSLRTEKAIDYIKSNYKEAITLKTVANHLEVSPDHLGRTFKKETGKSLVEFITEYKMSIAKDMLLTGNYKVYEVSNELGYKTSQYFSIVFKKINGIYPSDCLRGNYDD